MASWFIPVSPILIVGRISTVRGLFRLAAISAAGFISAVADVTAPPAASGLTVTGSDGCRVDAPPPSTAILVAAMLETLPRVIASRIAARALKRRHGQ